MKEIIITEQEQNQRLDKFLLKYFNTAPKSFIYKMLRKKRIKINHAKAEGSELLKAEDSIQFYLAEETMSAFMEEKAVHEASRHFGIIYEDDNVMIVLKPAGLLTHPEKSSDTDTLIDQILYYLYGKGQYNPSKESSFVPAVCNRLDRNTSGLIIAGKNLMAVQEINKAIAEGLLSKYYITMVSGEIKKKGIIENYYTKDEENNKALILEFETQNAKKIITEYTPLKMASGYTLLEIKLVTGKSHQIRAHLKSIGHPIVGDRKYGILDNNILFRQKFGLSNQFLHAYKIVWQKKEGALSYLFQKEFISSLPQPLSGINKEFFSWECR